MKTLIIYKNRYGDIEKYARWIQEASDAEMVPVHAVKATDLSKYDTVIFGGYCSVTHLHGCDVMIRNWSQLRLKNVIVFASSRLPLTSGQMRKVYEESIPPRILRHIQFFTLPATAKYEELKGSDKMWYVLLQLKKRMTNNKAKEKEALPNLKYSREWLKPLLEKIEEMSEMTLN